jgi:PPOX class probable F420-dependent enzyme
VSKAIRSLASATMSSRRAATASAIVDGLSDKPHILPRAMPSRRDLIRMTGDEVRDFLDEQKIVSVATIGPKGRPHLVPLWYVRDGDDLTGWTFAKSQKAKNLERDPHATLQVETGVEYQELRGVMLECDVQVEHNAERVADYGRALFDRYAPGGGEAVEGMIQKQAPKRIGLRFHPTRTVSWDHRKLEGVY